jgi:HSP90 family molecular chaperone
MFYNMLSKFEDMTFLHLMKEIANAVDATQKLKTYASSGEAKGELGELRIDITLDKPRNISPSNI